MTKNSFSNLQDIFSQLQVDPKDNFLAKPYSIEHGEGCYLDSEPAQVAAGLLKITLGCRGMIIILSHNRMSIVENFGEYSSFGIIECDHIDLSEAGEIYRDRKYDYIGVLIDERIADDGRHVLRVVSDDIYYLD